MTRADVGISAAPSISYQLALFSLVAVLAAKTLRLFLTMLLLFSLFVGLTYLGTATIRPKKLMETWPTVDPAVRPIDHLKQSCSSSRSA